MTDSMTSPMADPLANPVTESMTDPNIETFGLDQDHCLYHEQFKIMFSWQFSTLTMFFCTYIWLIESIHYPHLHAPLLPNGRVDSRLTCDRHYLVLCNKSDVLSSQLLHCSSTTA